MDAIASTPTTAAPVPQLESFEAPLFEQAPGELHDAHESHFQAAPCRPQGNNYLRSLEMYRTPPVYPARVRVFTHADAVHMAIERQEAQD